MTSIEVPTWDPCPFCDYLSGKRPYSILWRNDRAAILVTREQRGEGHVLVTTVAHKETVMELDDDECSDVMVATRQASKAIAAYMRAPAISVWQNNGILASQKIPHFHLHVAGTRDEGGTEWGKVEELPIRETEKIRSGLKLSFSFDS